MPKKKNLVLNQASDLLSHHPVTMLGGKARSSMLSDAEKVETC